MRELLAELFESNGPYLAMMRAGFAGLTDTEYLWEPVDDAWSVREGEHGEWSMEISYPDPDPSPFTTIAWRMAHLTGSVGVANATLRGLRRDDGAIDAFSSFAAPPTAEDAVRRWEGEIDDLVAGLGTASDDDLRREERQWWDPPTHHAPVWLQVVYFGFFEPASHGAEVRLLRDLYRHTDGGTRVLRQPTGRQGSA